MSKNVVVQKYGGSSVADLERLGKVADKVVETKRAGHPVVVVVSAMGKTTDGLLAQAREVDPEPPRRELDMLVSTGERVSMALLSIAIQKRGCEAISFTGSQAGIITDDRHFDARIVEVRPNRIEQELEKGRIVIVAGYQGVSVSKEITTLGRGGSDTTAVALAAALGAERCEIYSDVDGVYSADPRVVPEARHLPEIDYETLQTAAEAGAKVLNAQAVEWAKRAGIVIHARHTGQRYEGAVPAEGARQTLVRARGREARASAVSAERGVVLVTARGVALDELARAMEESGLAPRDLSVHEGGTSTGLFSLLNAPDFPKAKRALQSALGDRLTLREGLAAATVVGDGLTGLHGPFGAPKLAALAREAGVTLHAALVGPLRATLVVEEARVDELVRVLHRELLPTFPRPCDRARFRDVSLDSPTARAPFVVIEGVDGAGKGTQLELLAAALRARGRAVHVTCEPSTLPIGELLRRCLRRELGERTPGPAAMALLFAADRLQHLEQEIEPALASKTTVLCDRYDGSSIVYQAASAGDPSLTTFITDVNGRARRPDLTLVLDLDPELAAARREKRGTPQELYDRLELQRRIRAGYLRLSELRPSDRIVVIDASPSAEEVHAKVLAATLAVIEL